MMMDEVSDSTESAQETSKHPDFEESIVYYDCVTNDSVFGLGTLVGHPNGFEKLECWPAIASPQYW